MVVECCGACMWWKALYQWWLPAASLGQATPGSSSSDVAGGWNQIGMHHGWALSGTGQGMGSWGFMCACGRVCRFGCKHYGHVYDTELESSRC